MVKQTDCKTCPILEAIKKVCQPCDAERYVGPKCAVCTSCSKEVLCRLVEQIKKQEQINEAAEH